MKHQLDSLSINVSIVSIQVGSAPAQENDI